ncbi:MAG: radical SAM protein [Elusimicrobia bacterium]|nr:radical SAM protein [Elusimicrobiota bacterium]
MFNKEISKLKIALTSRCTMECTHCFVNKRGRETISMNDAANGLDLFLGSPGPNKILEIYGGEPLTEFELLKEITALAGHKARKLRRRLVISVASNGALLTEKHADYFRKNGIAFSLSFSGTRESHNSVRKFAGGQGSYDAVVKKFPLLFAKLKNNLHVIFCVHPESAANAYEDFKRLAELGFRNIGIECVHGFPWRGKNYSDFARSMEKITDYVRQKMYSGDFIILNAFMDFFKEKSYAGAFCPFFRDFEMFPDGAFSFYPYAFIRDNRQRKRIAVGNASSGLLKKYLECKPLAGSPACADCLSSYYCLPGLADGSRAYRLRTQICRQALKDIIALSMKKPAAKKYVKYLIKIFKKGCA